MNNETIALLAETRDSIIEGVQAGVPVAISAMQTFCKVMGFKAFIFVILLAIAIGFCIYYMSKLAGAIKKKMEDSTDDDDEDEDYYSDSYTFSSSSGRNSDDTIGAALIGVVVLAIVLIILISISIGLINEIFYVFPEYCVIDSIKTMVQ